MKAKQIEEKYNVNASLLSETKLFSVLSQFNIYELNRLGKFVKSPYFNKNESLTSLFDLIDKELRSKNGYEISKQETWQAVMQGQSYDDTKFRKLCSDLLKLIERFLIQEEFEKNDLNKAGYLLETIHNKKIKPLYNSAIRTAERLSDQYFFRPASYYYHEYAFERNYYMLTDYEIARSKESNVEAIVENLDKFYLAEKLRYYCTVISRSRLGAHEYRLLFMDDIIAHIEQQNFAEIVPINLYYQIYLTNKFPEDESHYFVLKDMITRHIRQLPELEAKEIMDSAYNYCIWNINRGKDTYTREIFDLYKESVKNELIYVNGLLDPWNFRNIIVSGLRLGEFDWVESFIYGYRDRIDEKYRDNAFNFNLANLHFYRKDYASVFKLLQSVEYDDPSYNRNSKVMLLLTYYELQETESLISLFASFELYLRRNKDIPEARKVPYLNLIKFLRSLTRLTHGDEKSLMKLRQKIAETEGVVNKGWLLEKVDQLL